MASRTIMEGVPLDSNEESRNERHPATDMTAEVVDDYPSAGGGSGGADFERGQSPYPSSLMHADSEDEEDEIGGLGLGLGLGGGHARVGTEEAAVQVSVSGIGEAGAGANHPGARTAMHQGPTSDWSSDAISDSHVFVPTSSGSGGETCHLDKNCKHQGQRLKCVACRIVAHEGCLRSSKRGSSPDDGGGGGAGSGSRGGSGEVLQRCRPTFCDSVRTYREQTTIQHHWVPRKSLKGKCKHCGKAFPSKLGFGPSRLVVGYSCSWCKFSYHNKDNCLGPMVDDGVCDLGQFAKVIVPPSWIVKRPRKGSFKSSLKNSPNRHNRKKRAGGFSKQESEDVTSSAAAAAMASSRHGEGGDRPLHAVSAAASSAVVGVAVAAAPSAPRPFCLKPIPSTISPVLVFINPKSGGNQGAKLMQKFQWLLNPRQVFDITDSDGPQPAIEMFRRVANVRLLACGGDGTVGWLLSVMDKMNLQIQPPVSVLPLGTGNDLSRSLGWGGGYMDEPISKILTGLNHAEEVRLDRWQLRVTRNSELPPTEKRGKDHLPLEVVNNYFSFGVCAQISLQFHEAREAHPEKFNSRIRNKMYYGQAGGKNLVLRKWRDLSDDVELFCDGRDLTPKLRDHRVHSVLFSNIPYFSSGTRPWNHSMGEQRIDDGLIEVIGLTTNTLPKLLAGGKGICIAQCKHAVVRTSKTIPMQVDGEARRLNPATIELSLLNQVRMLSKRKDACPKVKRHSFSAAEDQPGSMEGDQPLRLLVAKILMRDYAANHLDKERLKQLAIPFGEVNTTCSADLEQVRAIVSDVLESGEAAAAAAGTRKSSSSDSGGGVRKLERVVSGEEAAAGKVRSDWVFIDSVTAMRFFRIDRAQENLHYVSDICDEKVLYILDEENEEENSLIDKIAEEQATAADETDQAAKADDDVFAANNNEASSHDNNNVVMSREPVHPEKTTEGILKAARLGDLIMLTELHQAGYSLLSMDETGKTALHYGARFGHKEVLRFLIAKAPARVLDMVDSEKGQTALHKAAGYKRRTICCMLVAAGASLLIKDHAGLTPRQLAMMAEDNELASYLESQEEVEIVRRETGSEFFVNKGDFETPV